MADPLPFPDDHFDAVMSNVAAHMFSDAITRSVLAEVRRILRLGGLFLFHLSAVEDRQLRARFKRGKELEKDYVLADDGHTMRFFSREYLLELLSGWRSVRLEHIEILEHEAAQQHVQVATSDERGKKERMALLEQSFTPARHLWRGIIRL